ncbi:MAG: VWA domain-containing protein [Planctomycetaceae bacterium]|nr:VWA domain-containing protein [Planctomycetaceae bacterium]
MLELLRQHLSRAENELEELQVVRERIEAKQPDTEAYDAIVENPFLRPSESPLSTFAIDVDTASYSNCRRMLNMGQLPPAGAVRLEEFVNYFPYDYPQPTGDAPFSMTTEAARCPWNAEHVLVRIGLKGKEIHRKERPASNLVFLVDVSGSMSEPNKLPLVRESLKLLVRELGENDRVAMVVYAGNSGLVLAPTGGDRKAAILNAIEKLEAGGSTNGAAGIELAYQLATDNFIKGGVNRVVLATDGDFNVGVTSQDELVRLIEAKAESGVFFSALGYGMGNYKDSTLEKLADKGNGNYAYIDTLNEARKVLVEQMSGTLVTIAKDVKIQIEFNPARVAGYRLLGYENRILAAQDFNDDKKDAGEIGAGHSVTALYELIPTGKRGEKEAAGLPEVDPLKYQPMPEVKPLDAVAANELLTLKLRYKQPDGEKSKLLEQPLTDEMSDYAKASADFKFASAVAGFGMLLRDSKYKGSATFDAVVELAMEGVGRDEFGYRKEFVDLVRKAKELWKIR